MKLYPIAAAIGLLAPIYSFAQTPLTPANSSDVRAVVAQINKGWNASKNKIGDRITAKVIQDVVLGGKIVIPREARLIGHIADVTALTKNDPRSRLAVVFDRAEIRGSESLPIHGVLQALAPPLPDPALESIMASASYGGAESGHPTNGGLMSTGPTNTTTPVVDIRPKRSGTTELQERERALNNAEIAQSGARGPNGTVLSSVSRGVFGLPGLFLTATAPVSAIVAVGRNVTLKSGTQIVLKLQDASSQP